MATDDSEAVSGPVDAVGPWTIKASAGQTRNPITDAARTQGLTVGQWLQRRMNEWMREGQPVHVRADQGHYPGKPDLADVERIAAKITDMAAAGLPVPKSHVHKVSSALVAQLPASPLRLARPSPPELSDETG